MIHKGAPPPSMRRLLAQQSGSSLGMTMVAVGVIVLTMMVLIGGLSTTSHGVRANLDQANGQALARAQVESIKAEAYRPNPTAQPYATVSASSHYSVVVQVSYWVSSTSSWQSGVPAEDSGLQRVLVTARSTGASSQELISLSTLKRK